MIYELFKLFGFAYVIEGNRMTCLPSALHGTPCPDTEQSSEGKGTPKCGTIQHLPDSYAK